MRQGRSLNTRRNSGPTKKAMRQDAHRLTQINVTDLPRRITERQRQAFGAGPQVKDISMTRNRTVRAALIGAVAIAASALSVPAATAGPSQTSGASATAAPVRGSAQRRAILDALRPAVQAEIGPDIEFVVRDIRVVRGWAFVSAMPQRPGGAPIDGHRYFPYFDEMGGLNTTAVLRLENGFWTLVDHAIGATDVWYCDMGPPGLTPPCSGY